MLYSGKYSFFSNRQPELDSLIQILVLISRARATKRPINKTAFHSMTHRFGSSGDYSGVKSDSITQDRTECGSIGQSWPQYWSKISARHRPCHDREGLGRPSWGPSKSHSFRHHYLSLLSIGYHQSQLPFHAYSSRCLSFPLKNDVKISTERVMLVNIQTDILSPKAINIGIFLVIL